MAIGDFIATTFRDKAVDVYCGGKDWFYGTVDNVKNGVVTLSAHDGTIHVNIERILSVSPRG